MKALHIIAYVLVWIGGLNWGLIGLGAFIGGANWNVVNWLLGSWPQVEWAVYVLVGLATLWTLIGHSKDCRTCKA